jgi:hypothetical protein
MLPMKLMLTTVAFVAAGFIYGTHGRGQKLKGVLI